MKANHILVDFENVPHLPLDRIGEDGGTSGAPISPNEVKAIEAHYSKECQPLRNGRSHLLRIAKDIGQQLRDDPFFCLPIVLEGIRLLHNHHDVPMLSIKGKSS